VLEVGTFPRSCKFIQCMQISSVIPSLAVGLDITSFLALAAVLLALVSLVVSIVALKGSPRVLQAELNEVCDKFDHYIKRERVREARKVKAEREVEAEQPEREVEYARPKDALRAQFGDGGRFFGR